MTDEETWLREAVRTLGLDASQVAFLLADDAQRLASQVERVFVEGSPRTWWLGFRGDLETFPYGKQDWGAGLCRMLHLLGGERVWLVVDHENGTYTVADCNIDVVPDLLGECPFFEYYLVGRDTRHICADTDHNQFIFVTAP